MLEINGIRKTFFPGTPNEVRALQGVDFKIEEGSWVCVVGTNGSGKSTLLNAVAGTFFVDEGTIRLADKNITRWPEHKRARLVGRVFQDPFSGTAPSMTIAENLAMAARRGLRRGLLPALTSTKKNDLRDRVAAMGLGLEDRLDNPIGTLSGGQRQSLTLLMAGLRRPSILLLDEHTAALDPKSADQVIHLTQQFIEKDRLTTMMVTHSMPQAASLGDRVIMMDRGRIVMDISGQEKKRLRPEGLLAKFEELRRANQLDEAAAEILRAQYI
ncbi:MAG: ABC transporter ATP-binding protein [Blastopirellula sp.]|nr:ABC transporter ATP-binding protein [Blastopirellula sp.]